MQKPQMIWNLLLVWYVVVMIFIAKYKAIGRYLFDFCIWIITQVSAVCHTKPCCDRAAHPCDTFKEAGSIDDKVHGYWIAVMMLAMSSVM